MATAVSSFFWKAPNAPLFKDRQDAGLQLGQKLLQMYEPQLLANAIILGCVRGGLPVAKAVLDELRTKIPNAASLLDIVVARKIGLPSNKDYGIGALAADGKPHFIQWLVDLNKIDVNSSEIRAQVQREFQELQRRESVYRGGKPPLSLEGRTVILVDDMIAGGGTIQAIVKSLLGRSESERPSRILIAVPIAAKKGLDIVKESGIPESDICLCECALPPPKCTFNLDDYYTKLGDVEDAEVLEILSQVQLPQ
jgi:putative phosphoribosyl transferase